MLLQRVRAEQEVFVQGRAGEYHLCRCIAHHTHQIDVHVPAEFLLQIVLNVDARQLCKPCVNAFTSESEYLIAAAV